MPQRSMRLAGSVALVAALGVAGTAAHGALVGIDFGATGKTLTDASAVAGAPGLRDRPAAGLKKIAPLGRSGVIGHPAARAGGRGNVVLVVDDVGHGTNAHPGNLGSHGLDAPGAPIGEADDGLDPAANQRGADLAERVAIDVAAVRKLPTPVGLDRIKADRRLAGMALVRISRLSVQPVSEAEWKIICQMGGL